MAGKAHGEKCKLVRVWFLFEATFEAQCKEYSLNSSGGVFGVDVGKHLMQWDIHRMQLLQCESLRAHDKHICGDNDASLIFLHAPMLIASLMMNFLTTYSD